MRMCTEHTVCLRFLRNTNTELRLLLQTTSTTLGHLQQVRAGNSYVVAFTLFSCYISLLSNQFLLVQRSAQVQRFYPGFSACQYMGCAHDEFLHLAHCDMLDAQTIEQAIKEQIDLLIIVQYCTLAHHVDKLGGKS